MSNPIIYVIAILAGIGIFIFISFFFSKKRRYEIEYNKGIEAYQAEKFEEALGYFQKATRINPDKPDAFYNLGLVYMDMQKNPQSEKNFMRAIQLGPNDPDSYYNLGLLYLNMEKFESALKQFLKVLDILPDDAESL